MGVKPLRFRVSIERQCFDVRDASDFKAKGAEGRQVEVKPITCAGNKEGCERRIGSNELRLELGANFI